MKLILETTFVLVAIFGVPTQQTLVIAALGNGEKIPLDVTVHHDYALVVSGNPLVPQPFFKPSINLYDMEKNLEARKVLEDKACYIRKFSGPRKPKDVRLKMKAMEKSKETHHVTEDWNLPESEIPEADREQVLGKRVNDFCSGYQVFWLKEGNHVTRRQGNVERKRQVKWSHRFNNGLSVNAGLSPDLTSNLGLGYKKGPWSFNGGLSHNSDSGVTSNIGAGYTFKNGAAINAGFNHNHRFGGNRASIGLSIPLFRGRGRRRGRGRG